MFLSEAKLLSWNIRGSVVKSMLKRKAQGTKAKALRLSKVNSIYKSVLSRTFGGFLCKLKEQKVRFYHLTQKLM